MGGWAPGFSEFIYIYIYNSYCSPWDTGFSTFMFLNLEWLICI